MSKVVSAALKEVLVWDPHTLQTTHKHSPGCAAVVETPGGLVGIAGDPRELRYYSQTDSSPQTQRYEGEFTCLAMCDGVVVGGTKEGLIWIWEGCTGRNWLRIPGNHSVTSLVINDHSFFAGRDSGLIEAFRISELYGGLTSPRFAYSHHTQTVTGLVLVQNEVVSASTDGQVIRCNNGTVISTDSLGVPVTAVTAVYSHTVYVGTKEGAVHRCGKLPAAWHWQDHSITALLLIDDVQLLVATASSIISFNLVTETTTQEFTSHTSPPTSLLLLTDPSTQPLPRLSPTLTPVSGLVPLPPGPEIQFIEQHEDELPKLQTLNRWLYGMWVDAWL